MIRKRAGSNATHPTGRTRLTGPSGAPDRLFELLRIELRARNETRESCGARRVRTADLLLAKQVLSRLSYGPVTLVVWRNVLCFPRSTPVVGLGGLEPPTSPLSGVRSNQLSYRPELVSFDSRFDQAVCAGARRRRQFHFGKEVIQPQVPLRLPCYDFTPVINHTVVTALPKVKQATSGAANSHGVTGGVYKARERIHRSVLICDY